MFDRPAFGAIAVSLSFGAVPAYADVTAAEVWARWQELAAEYNQEFSVGSETADGGTLTISDLKVSMDANGAALLAQIDEVVFEELDNGTVAITSAPSYPLRVTGTDENGVDFDVTLTVSQQDLSMIASGDSSETRYAYSIPNLGIEMSQMLVDGEPFDMNLEISVLGLTGDYSAGAGSKPEIGSNLTADGFAMRMNAIDPANPDSTVDVSVSMEDIQSDSTGTMTTFDTAQPLGAMLAAGLTSRGGLGYGKTLFNVTTTGPEAISIDGSIDSGRFDANLGDGGIVYGGTNTGINVGLSGPTIPFPTVGFAIAESSGQLTMPLVPSDEPQSFGLVSSISGLSIDDVIWQLFDPTGVLPRDPASLLIDLGGQGNWLVDITDPANAAEMESSGEMPGEIQSLDINELSLSVAGTELNGSGAFSFNNETGMPQPSGAVTFNLSGANTLIDKLVGMGLVPEEQAMGARMMLGLFARPGEGEDVLTSTIEVNEDGSVLANGQRIR